MSLVHLVHVVRKKKLRCHACDGRTNERKVENSAYSEIESETAIASTTVTDGMIGNNGLIMMVIYILW